MRRRSTHKRPARREVHETILDSRFHAHRRHRRRYLVSCIWFSPIQIWYLICWIYFSDRFFPEARNIVGKRRRIDVHIDWREFQTLAVDANIRGQSQHHLPGTGLCVGDTTEWKWSEMTEWKWYPHWPIEPAERFRINRINRLQIRFALSFAEAIGHVCCSNIDRKDNDFLKNGFKIVSQRHMEMKNKNGFSFPTLSGGINRSNAFFLTDWNKHAETIVLQLMGANNIIEEFVFFRITHRQLRCGKMNTKQWERMWSICAACGHE